MQIIETKKSAYIRKELIPTELVLVHQHGCRLIILEHQYGCRDVT